MPDKQRNIKTWFQNNMYFHVFSCQFCPPGLLPTEAFLLWPTIPEAFWMLFITIKVWSHVLIRCRSHTMSKTFRELVALPSIAHYRSVSFEWMHCTYASSSFRSLTFLGWNRKTKELLLRLQGMITRQLMDWTSIQVHSVTCLCVDLKCLT